MKWLKPKRDSSLQKQDEQEAQKKEREALCVQEFHKRSVRVITRLRELEGVQYRILKQFASESRECHQRTVMSKYFTDDEALSAYITNFVRKFDLTHLRQEAISRSKSWRLSQEEARKEIMDKREKQVLERREIVKRRAELMKLATKESSVTVSSKTVQFAPTVCTSVVETQSGLIYVGDESRDTLPMKTEAAQTGGGGKADKEDTSASRTQKSKSETLDFDKLSMGSNCSNSSQKRQKSVSCRLKQQQLKLELESKRNKNQVEQYQRQKEEELRQLQEKMELLELEDELRQCGREIQSATVDGVYGCKVDDSVKDLGLDDNRVACSDAGSGFMVPIVSEADVRAHPPNDFHSTGLNDNNDNDGFDFSTLTIKAEETPRYSLFLPTSVGSPVKRLPGEFTPTYFQTRSLPTGNVKPATMAMIDQHGANEVTFSGRALPNMKLRYLAGDTMEWPEWSGMLGEVHSQTMRR